MGAMNYGTTKAIDGTTEYGTVTGTGVAQSDPYDRRTTYGFDAFAEISLLTVAAKTAAEGAGGDFDETTDEITITAHGYQDGVVVRLTTTGTIPTGLAAATDYWVGVVDANTIKLYSSLANLIAGTAVDFTDKGGAGDTTLTQQTDDVDVYVDVAPTSDGPWCPYGGMSAEAFASGVWHKHFETSAPWVRCRVEINKGNATTIEAWLTSMG